MRSMAMVFALALALALAAACGGDKQIVLEVAGAAPGADRVEVLLLEPMVLAKRQLDNRTEPTSAERLETVFYMAERSRTAIPLDGAPLHGLQFELQDTGGPYVPLVAARSGEQLLALGVYDPASIFAAQLGREHAPSAVSAVGDVTIFPIELEPVVRVFAPPDPTPQAVKPSEVMTVSCASSGGALSGFAWRRADQKQLRVMTVLPRADEDRLQPPDLDCDEHSPGAGRVNRMVTGDELDCDDTAPTVHGAAREQCSRFDEDCNSVTTLSPAECPQACPGPISICACDDASGEASGCVAPLYGEPCKVPSMSSGPGRTPCDSAGPLVLPLICQGGCEVLLAWAPPGLEVKISDGEGQVGQGLGKWVPITDGKAFLSVEATRPFASALQVILARIKTGTTIKNHAIPLTLVEAAACGAPSQLECPMQ